MKKLAKIVACMLGVMLFASVSGCNLTPDDGGKPVNPDGDNPNTPTITRTETDTRNLKAAAYTQANMTATDKVDREALAGDIKNGDDVGVFYHTWHGVHETPGKVLDITKLLKENPDYLTSDYLTENSKAFHYWGEPLYGYYCSADPWVITRHIELMMAMGIDFLVYDYTNAATYDTEADAIFEILQKYYDQGFDVPKVTFYTNSYSPKTVNAIYSRYYEKELYKNLWYAPNGKPLIIGVKEAPLGGVSPALWEMLTTEFFDFRESQWPDSKTTIENMEVGFPWMSWVYPQKNFNGMMSVSLAQHPGAKMSFGAELNNGRGYDWTKNRNYSKNMQLGTNYEGQWATVFKNNEDKTKQHIDQVLVTGFNEWMAQKLDDGDRAYFVDTFSQEYSRDIEMMKGGYDDNYVIQTLTNTRKYKYTEAKHYKYELNTMNITDFAEDAWATVKSKYVDMVGDAMARDYRDVFRTTKYTDNSNRNDIASVYVTHDENNLYVRVKTAKEVSDYNGTDVNWMNLLIKTQDGNENSFGGFNYIINRTPDTQNGTTSIEKSKGGYDWESVGESAAYAISDNVMMYRIPLAALGLDKDNCYVRIKACDNVTVYDDIMDYYVSGDCAPIGRFAYAYGY